MNLVDKLLKADAKRAEELETKKMKSKRLAKILGEEEVEITIQEIPARRMNDIVATQFTNKGRFDHAKGFEAKALCCVEGIIDPPIKDETLLRHFMPNGGTPKDLVVKLFGNEINEISDAITVLSGAGNTEEDEEEIKN